MNWLQKNIVNLALKVGGFRLTDPNALRGFYSKPSYSGRDVTDNTAMQVAAVWSCVRILSETIGSLPWAIFERKADGSAVKVDHGLGDVMLGQPNADMTSTEFREALVVNLCLRGNSYCLRETNAMGAVVSLYPIPSDKVEPKRNDKTDRIDYRVNDRGRWETLPRDKVWHVKGFGSNGLMGFSPIAYARQAMGISLAAEEFQGRFFSQGAKPSFVATIPQWLKQEQRPIARENLQALWSGLENAHKIQLLEGGLDVKPLTMPLEDAQFLQLRGFSIQEICRIYRIPPHMVADLERSTNNNIEHQGLEFVMFTLQPYLTRIEDSAQRWLFSARDRAKYFLRFNVEGLLRADAVARAQLYATLLQNGVYSRNEVRALENRNRVDGLDEYTVQSNMALVQFLDQLGRAAQPKQGSQP